MQEAEEKVLECVAINCAVELGTSCSDAVEKLVVVEVTRFVELSELSEKIPEVDHPLGMVVDPCLPEKKCTLLDRIWERKGQLKD